MIVYMSDIDYEQMKHFGFCHEAEKADYFMQKPVKIQNLSNLLRALKIVNQDITISLSRE